MKPYQRIQWLLLALAMSLNTVLAKPSYNNFVFETESITVAARVYYGLEATFYADPKFFKDDETRRINLGKIRYGSDDCIYSYFKKWPDVTRKKDKCSNLSTWQGGENNLSGLSQRNYTELFSPKPERLNLFAGALVVELSPVRKGHKVFHKVTDQDNFKADASPYIPAGEVMSDVRGGYEIIEAISCDPEKRADPEDFDCEKGYWRDDSFLAWPGNVKQRKMIVNVDGSDDGGVILTFYNFQEARHGLNIYTYDYKDVNEHNKYKNLRIDVVSKIITAPSVSNTSASASASALINKVNNTHSYNSTSAKSNNAAASGFVSNSLKILFSMLMLAFNDGIF